jgi:hypothetical protein
MNLAFPTQVAFTVSKPQKVMLTNSGLGILTIKNISVNGQFTQTHTCGTTVKLGARCQISISFDPNAIGVLTGRLSISDNAVGSPQGITLTGTGLISI